MTLQEQYTKETERPIKLSLPKSGIDVYAPDYVQWLETKLQDHQTALQKAYAEGFEAGSNANGKPEVSAANGNEECYKYGGICRHNCPGQCRESC